VILYSCEKIMLLIKLGGSVITHKDQPFSPNLKNLYGIARVLADYREYEREKQICIVHGGGSFAHVVASQYARQLTLTTKNRRGISLITWSARKLNDRVIESLVDYDLPVFPLQTSSIMVLNKKRLSLHTDLLRAVLANGWIPVLYGDIIVGQDEVQIVSGERILDVLARDFEVEKIIVCTNAQGVLIDVKEPSRGIVKSINPENIRSIMRTLGSSTEIDVTGGMKGKVKILYNIAVHRGIRSIIIDGTDFKTLRDCLNGANCAGTWIEGTAVER